ncbi:hypothetical protein MQC88_09440 [Luteimonas sp. 50]|uniref:Lipoprotein n=1 Tax=Cognatiluteimonas sedimenti TaxID=2927791 RepID=A0ABT0A5B2_9GAMM|nr:hypothetical protein [Lysobacter sedimenti]MCJ0826166.1 hypothetical protein [Lysobacter sedimenti]
MTAFPRLTVLSALLLCAACGKPEPPPTDEPPEPRAQAAPTAQATELRDAIQRPIERARAVEPQVLDAASQQRAEIEAQTGG